MSKSGSKTVYKSWDSFTSTSVSTLEILSIRKIERHSPVIPLDHSISKENLTFTVSPVVLVYVS